MAQRVVLLSRTLLLFICVVWCCVSVHAAQPPNQNASPQKKANESDMPAQQVRFHAWGGSAQVNGYIRWLSEQLKQKHNITLQHVKLADTSDAVARVLAEKAAGNIKEGSVDLIWINGENFATMKKHGLLAAKWVGQLPNFALTNPDNNPAMTTDFGEATMGMEAPWGRASMVFYTRQSHLQKLQLNAPTNIQQLLLFSQQAPGRFTYPAPNDYLGISFLKYALLSLNPTQYTLFYQPVTAQALDDTLPSLWQFLDALHPNMWREGRTMVRQASQLQRLVGTGELSLAFTFTAAEIPSAVERFDLPTDIRTYPMDDGSLANVHFLGLTFNSPNRQAAIKVVNFMLSAEAQAEKQKIAVWGDDTVLDMRMLSDKQQRLFKEPALHPSALDKTVPISLLAEPHASWTDALRNAWYERYGARY